jgi:catechol 2,3-dioxygenase-like lactoylglutathione lyase family enzyme
MYTMTPASFARHTEDVGNIVHLEHVNLRVPDQRLATLFYVSGLGLTRDPYMMTGVDNMWVNAGRTQFHLPTGQAQRLRGHIGLVVPEREALLGRLRRVAPLLGGTAFQVTEHAHHVEAVCPWGNTVVCHPPESDPGHAAITLGIAYVAFDVAAGSAATIARFYREVVGAPATVSTHAPELQTCTVRVGANQSLRFQETHAAASGYDGHHIQIYVADFSGPHRRLQALGLVTEESNRHQYRFEQLRCSADAVPCFTIEHEVRSLTHPLYARPLVNRNPRQDNRNYRPGQDAFTAF